jgi:hypothetical protein
MRQLGSRKWQLLSVCVLPVIILGSVVSVASEHHDRRSLILLLFGIVCFSVSWALVLRELIRGGRAGNSGSPNPK